MVVSYDLKLLVPFVAGLCWKIYSGAKKSTKQRAAIFVIERKAFDQRLTNASKADKDFLWDLYKKAISQLTRLRHPQILTVQHPLEESRDCLAFATEPVRTGPNIIKLFLSVNSRFS
jgi:SCY1-like protein 2